MPDYIKNFKKVSGRNITYTTKKMYLYNDVKFSAEWLIISLVTPIPVFALIIFIAIHWDIDSSTFAAVITLVLIFIPLFILGFCIYSASKLVIVDLFFNSINKELELYAKDYSVRKIYDPQSIRAVIRYYQLYSHGSSNNKIILISLEILGRQKKHGENPISMRFASIPCNSIQEARNILLDVMNDYQDIANWLNIPMIYEIEKIFIKDTEEAEKWYLL